MRSSGARHGIWVVCLSSLGVAGQGPPQVPPTFGTGITLIEVDVSVLDRNRRPVRGLTASDFTILEEGRPQQIQTFAAIELPPPPETRWMREIVSDVRRNGAREGRLVAILLDDAQTEPRMVQRVQDAARRLVDALSPGDLAAVIFTKDNSRSLEFTEDRGLLKAAIESLHAGFTPRMRPLQPPSLGGSGDRQAQAVKSPDSGDTMPEMFQQYSVNVLGKVASGLSDIRKRRKAIFYVSPGVPVNRAGSSGHSVTLVEAMKDAVREATLANVTIYPIDPSENPFLLRSTLRREYLQFLADGTGGFTVGEQDDLAEGVAQVLEETGSYYLLGYHSPALEADGKLRSIDIQVNRPDVTAHARRGYRAPRARTGSHVAPAALEVAGVMAASDIEMQAFATPFAKAGQSESAVAVILALRQPAPPDGSRLKETLDLSIAAYAPEGRLKASRRDTYNYTLRPADDVVAYEVFSQIDLKPGTYLLRIAAKSAAQGKSGSVYYDLEVPDFSKRAVSLSGLVLTAAPAPAVVGKDRLASLMPVGPTSQREFDRETRVVAFARVYRSGKSTAPVALATKIEDGRSTTVFQIQETLSLDRFKDGRAVDHDVELPIARLTPGPHLVTIEARLADGEWARRVLRFTVVR